MDARGQVPAATPSVADLTPLVEGEGPFLTLQMATEGAVEQASQQNQLRWRGHREALASAGASEKALTHIDGIVPDAHHHGRTLFAVATADELLHLSHWSQRCPSDLARWAPLPSLTPLISLRQASPPYVLVVADRLGADITGVRSERDDINATAGDPRTNPERKV